MRALDRLRAALPTTRPIALHEPEVTAEDRRRVDQCLATGWVSSVGPEIDRFEEALSGFTGIPHAVATVNGTAALHTALMLAGVAADDEVLTPALTFVGTANPVRYQGAWPHFVDCESDTLGIDPGQLENHLQACARLTPEGCINRQTGRRIRAMIVVHVLGIPARMPELRAIARHWRLALIEDAAEALGSHIENRHVGQWADYSILSFNGNKIISSGGGGALLCRDAEQAALARHLTTTAKQAHAWEFIHERVAYNYRMPNLNAALGLSQLDRLPHYLADKERLHRRYVEAFATEQELTLHRPPADRSSNHWLSLLLMPNAQARDELLAAAHADGIQLRPFWEPLHRLPMYETCPRAALPVTEELHWRGVCLPGTPGLAR